MATIKSLLLVWWCLSWRVPVRYLFHLHYSLYLPDRPCTPDTAGCCCTACNHSPECAGNGCILVGTAASTQLRLGHDGGPSCSVEWLDILLGSYKLDPGPQQLCLAALGVVGSGIGSGLWTWPLATDTRWMLHLSRPDSRMA